MILKILRGKAMRRYTILLLTGFMLILAAVAGATFPVDADKKNSAVPMQELLAYTTLPAETITILSETYERENHVRVNFIPLTPQELIPNLREKPSDLILTDSKILSTAADLNLLTPYISETNDAVKNNFKDAYDRWIGIWYDPIIFCINRDYLRKIRSIPSTWEELAKLKNVRIGITDFLAADASSNLMFQMIGNFGDTKTYEILGGIHKNVVQYARYLSNPVRQTGMGEADISIAVESETLRYMQNHYPLKIIYPEDGTACIITGVGISTTESVKNVAAAKFADWLLSDDAQISLQKNGFYFLSTNPQSLAYKTFAGKNLVLFKNNPKFTEQQCHEFLDRWVKEVRFK